MTKDEALALVSNTYNMKLNGVNTFTINSVNYTFVNGTDIISGLNLAKTAAQLLGRTTVKFKDMNGVYNLPISEFDQLFAQLVIKGNGLWEQKVDKQERIKASTTEAEYTAIVNESWI